ncbi:MAG: hypothetical protein RL235_201 [Chlamydiota bacterium]|jgi:hypothetical protein
MLINIVYDLPNWLLLLIILSLVALISIVGQQLVRRVLRTYCPGVDDQVPTGLSSLAGVLYAIVLGFIAVSVWGAFDRAVAITAKEANITNNIWLNARIYPNPLENQIRTLVEQYLHLVIEKEWPLQRRGKESPQAQTAIEGLYRVIIDFNPNTQEQIVVHAETVRMIFDLFDARRLRAYINNHGLETVLWSTLLLGAFLMFVFAWSLLAKTEKGRSWYAVLFGVINGLIIFLIVAFDYPYRGATSVRPEAYIKVLAHLERLSVEQPAD